MADRICKAADELKYLSGIIYQAAGYGALGQMTDKYIYMTNSTLVSNTKWHCVVYVPFIYKGYPVKANYNFIRKKHRVF